MIGCDWLHTPDARPGAQLECTADIAGPLPGVRKGRLRRRVAQPPTQGLHGYVLQTSDDDFRYFGSLIEAALSKMSSIAEHRAA